MTKQIHRAIFPIAIATASADGGNAAPVDGQLYPFDFVASTQTTDRYGRIVIQDWDTSDYETNPVILWDHNMHSEVIASFPIGFSKSIGVDGSKLIGRGNLVDKNATPLAGYAREGVHQGSIRAVSVGWECGDLTITPDGDLIMTGNKLIEISLCAIGANPDATIQNNAATFATLRAQATKQTKERKQMKQIATILGLAETASEAEVEAVASALVSAKKEMSSLKEKADKFDALADKYGAVIAERAASQRAALIAKGRAEGKLTPENEPKLLAVCDEVDGKGLNLAKFEALVEALPPVVNMKAAVTPTPADAAETFGLTERQIAKCKLKGWSLSDFAKRLEANRASARADSNEDKDEGAAE